MVKEIDDETSRILAKELMRSFAENPNSRVKHSEELVKIHSGKLNILEYNAEDLLANPRIRGTLRKGYMAVKKHAQWLKDDPVALDNAFYTELSRVIELGRKNLKD